MPSPRRRAAMSPALVAFGRQLRRYREAAGLSQSRIGSRTGTTASFVSQVEKGKKRCKRSFLEAIEPDLRSGGALLALYDDLANDNAVAYPSWFDWPTIEADALMLVAWQPRLVDGLLQSEAYAAAILRGNEKAIQTRLARQAVLTRDEPPPPAFNLLLDETVLYREVGDAGVMREQLIQLAARISDHITVQIVPSRGEHDGNNGGAVILAKMDDMSEIAHIDTVAHGLTMGEPDELAAVHKALMEIRALAYSVRESVQIINRVVEERWT